MDWIDLAQEMGKSQAVVNAVIIFWFHIMQGIS
jgi:hypothetical protein